MAWYRAGTVSVTSGSAVVTGANTDFVSNTQQGEAFLGPDGRTYEIATVISATQIFLTAAYQGSTAGAAGFAIMPTSSFARDLALGAAELLNTFASVRDGVGAGLIQDGTTAAPGIRFANDQDTGLARYNENMPALVAGGVATVAACSAGLMAFGFGGAPVNPKSLANIGPYGSVSYDVLSVGTVYGHNFYYGEGNRYYGRVGGRALGLRFGDDGATIFMNVQGGDVPFDPTTAFKIDTGGNMLVGASSGNCHAIRKDAAIGAPVLALSQGSGFQVANFFAVNGSGADGANGAAAPLKLSSAGNGRSLAAVGTINASGADYAEYMTKAASCGAIAAGDVCGVDIEGKLTRQWAAAISFVVKSTAPSLVGGDVWAADLQPKPEVPGSEPVAPGKAPTMPDENAPEALATWREMALAHTALVNAYPAEHAAWVLDQANYEAALEAWEDDLETARQCVDRIAFCGQVPVNVTGDFSVGDYIIAVANGSGIKAVAVAEADITFEQYRRRIGKVWAVRKARAWVDVQHG